MAKVDALLAKGQWALKAPIVYKQGCKATT